MKKLTFKILLIIFASVLTSKAQPTLVGTNCNPQLYDNFVYNRTNYFSPGNSGSNQVWNLSAISPTAINSSTVIPLGSTPNPTVPNANLCVNTGTLYNYHATNSTAFQNCSGIASSSIHVSYTDPEDILHYPFTYNNTFTDTWAGSYQLFSNPMNLTGTTTVLADGHGTVITPHSTYTNALRVHITTTIMETPGSSTFTITRYRDEYRWYSPGVRYHVAAVFTTTNSTNNDPSGGMFISGHSMSVDENLAQVNSLVIYPMPASKEFNLYFEEGIPQKIDIDIYNSIGQKIKALTNLYSNEKSTTINIQELTSGIYYLGIKTEVGSFNKKIIVVR